MPFVACLQELRSFKLEVDVDARHHTKIIGRRGAVITKVRQDHDVQIQFPDKDSDRPNVITIIGLEVNANSARDDILKKVHELVSCVLGFSVLVEVSYDWK